MEENHELQEGVRENLRTEIAAAAPHFVRFEPTQNHGGLMDIKGGADASP
jgi:hypothetical protein